MQSANEFYADRGLVRTSITFHPDTVETLKRKADELKVTQGEVVDAFAAILESNPELLAQFNVAIESIKAEKLRVRSELKEKKKKLNKLLREGKLDNVL